MTDHHRAFVPKRTIEELCCISGSRAPHVPPLPPDSTPNLESIQQVYDIAFAPGLDKFLETGTLPWFTHHGFSHLVADRGLLAQFLLYLTIISNNHNPNQPENAATQSQEARITWALLNLVVKPAHDGNEEADKFSRRIRAVEALLTGEPLTIVRGSMADFIHSEDGAMDMDPAPSMNKDVSSVLEKQVQRRSEEFWKYVEKFAEAPRPPPESVDDPSSPLNQAREILDGLENRDILYSMMLLCASHGHDEHPGSRPVSRAGSVYGGNGNGNGHHQKEPALARRFLDSEYTDGRASNSVFATVAGLASRAFQRD